MLAMMNIIMGNIKEESKEPVIEEADETQE